MHSVISWEKMMGVRVPLYAEYLQEHAINACNVVFLCKERSGFNFFFVSCTICSMTSVVRNSPALSSVFLFNTTFVSEDNSFARLKYKLNEKALMFFLLLHSQRKF